MLSTPSILYRHIPALPHCLVWLVVPIGKRHRCNGQNFAPSMFGDDIALARINMYEFGMPMILDEKQWRAGVLGKGGGGPVLATGNAPSHLSPLG